MKATHLLVAFFAIAGVGMYLVPDDPAAQARRQAAAEQRAVAKAARDEAKEARQAVFAKLGPEPGLYTIKAHLKSIARHPSSVRVHKCGGAKQFDAYWEIRCDWSAANGLGGMNRQTNTFQHAYGVTLTAEAWGK